MTNEWHQVKALVIKDVWLHGRPIVLLLTANFAVYASLLSLAPWLFPDTRLRALVSALFMPLVLYAGLISSVWLIETERMKGTLALLRTLPVSDGAIILSKLLLSSAVQMVTGTAAILLLLPSLLEPRNLAFCPVLVGGLVTFGNLSILTRLRFGTRLGGVLPFLILLVPSAAMIALGWRVPAGAEYLVESVRAPTTVPAWLAAELLVNVSLWLYLTRWLPTQDTSELLE
ncbi:MAG: hypothetical protein GEV06_08860 [Luteitalea sp.]|nr:hypothetical protein [Luteitalea sp.]